ncbi:MAG: S8 family serine peptidase [Candidatus Aminicenantes bacterium]|nr:S8 family serine peptidase [Candidatus Aminicenantes bacterium]
MKKKLYQSLFLGLVVLAVFTLFLISKPSVQESPPPNQDLFDQGNMGKDGHPKMEYALYKKIQYYLAGQDANTLPFVQKVEEELEPGGIIQVIVEAPLRGLTLSEQSKAKTMIQTFIENVGGSVEKIRKNRVQCRLPLNILLQMADLPFVKYIRLPIRDFTMVTTEGVSATGADTWQSTTAYRGNGAKVGVLDLGFKGYTSLLGTELPSTVTAQSFRTDGDIEAGSVHGTACTEIVHDMAPDANLYLANYSTLDDKEDAVDWLLSQGVNVITSSTGNYTGGAGDGTGPYCEIVKTAYDAGVPYVNSAGNAAQDHWRGTWSDTDSDKWHNFSGLDEICYYYVPSYTLTAIYLKWYDWGGWDGTSYGGSDQDFDLYLYIYSGGIWQYVDHSYNWQNGTQWPTEAVGYWYATGSTYWGAAIRKYSATKNVTFDLYVTGNSSAIEYPVAASSLVIPADSEHAITAGANDFASPYNIHYYSSRGPNLAGIIKPDIASPSGVSTDTYGYANFFGTSASAPHVAGAIALMLGKTPYTPMEVWTILQSRAGELGAAGKDNVYGYGRLKLDK